ncbi:MAG: sensor histidine kinase [Lachnospiraceae bacterium]|nr:sensor histidine kinase [Lachnospiraceae bacterium]
MELEFLITIPCYIAYIWAVNGICKKYFATSKTNEIAFITLLFAKYMLLNIINYLYNMPYILNAFINHIFFILLILLFFREEIEKKILLSSILLTASILIGDFSISLLSCIGLFLMHTVRNIETPFLGIWENCIIVYIATVIEIIAIYWLSKRLKAVLQDKIKRWYVILAVPLLAITGVIDMAGWGATKGIMVRSGGYIGLYYDQLFSHAEFCVLSLLSMFAAGVYVFGMDRIYLEQKKSNQYSSQLAVYKMLKELDDQSERLRHDMKNHIISLTSLYNGKEWGKLGEYLSNMEQYADIETGMDISGNKVVDAILYRKHKLAEEKKIMWECDVQIPRLSHINEFDLCIMFGNILDNALEACEKIRYSDNKFINIQSKIVKKCFILEVKNSADIQSNIQSKNHTGYGIGLLNVKDVVDKYNGVMNIEILDGIFTVSILLPLDDTV